MIAAVSVAVIVSFVLAFAFLSQSDKDNANGNFTDYRDSKVYKFVKIGKQVWMAENLNYAIEGSRCYNYEAANCAKYGQLYDWKTAQEICPPGWHLPSCEEWQNLFNFTSSKEGTAKKLKAKSGWSKSGNGMDDYGFSALPGGYSNPDGSFSYAGNGGYWWSTDAGEHNYYAYYRGMDYNYEYILYGNNDKSLLFSVRCVMD
jgi:uncharacterized protein (TIGR02145 family)